ncbi:hypothetical protein DUNSADRAFT_14976 [Dunaliella salina]|uniref:Secreted protein n=1 Tax=Dunaliella salina TaxID=3046 RepID=A0ABQ7H278_DUNSA|nr:hypothetical protein DUNSADRAFT_14976 [Dunaliella salina]|eukprot:KAF5840952.1 hypothetical protein DUNSADRAFT_14976 [Dunaliella salina]
MIILKSSGGLVHWVLLHPAIVFGFLHNSVCRFHPWQEIFPNAHELSCAAHHTFLIDTSFMPGSRSCLQILINYFLCAVCSTEQEFGMC